jgi:hypothetical protein
MAWLTACNCVYRWAKRQIEGGLHPLGPGRGGEGRTGKRPPPLPSPRGGCLR